MRLIKPYAIIGSIIGGIAGEYIGEKSVQIIQQQIKPRLSIYIITIGLRLAIFIKYLIGFPIGYAWGKFVSLFRSDVPDFEIRKEMQNKGFLEFPGGINDWFAFGLTAGVFFAIFIVVAISLGLTDCSKKCYMAIFTVMGIYLYYRIYFKDIKWLTKKINKISKKFYA